MNKPINKTKVLVAMSGGVDSAVAAILLKRLGYQVTGVTLQLAAPSCGLGACCTGRDLQDVKTMCAYEGFDHHLVLAREDFKSKVINYTVDTYAKGMTPSPCVWCNSKVRFDHLYQTMLDCDCDLLITGHYAHIIQHQNQYSLLAGVDPNKDQSYFLSMINKDMLPRIRFPLGNMTKPTVRKIARRFGIIVASKKDSQDLCFVKESYTQTLWNMRPEIFKPGNIVNTQGAVVGSHDGIAQYTIGQRRGIGHINKAITSYTNPLYVVDIKPNVNEVVVGYQHNTACKYIHLSSVNFMEDFQEGMFVEAKIRARSHTAPARLWNNGTLLEFCTPMHNVARGQICVMYQKRKVIAAGLIENFTHNKKQYLTTYFGIS